MGQSVCRYAVLLCAVSLTHGWKFLPVLWVTCVRCLKFRIGIRCMYMINIFFFPPSPFVVATMDGTTKGINYSRYTVDLSRMTRETRTCNQHGKFRIESLSCSRWSSYLLHETWIVIGLMTRGTRAESTRHIRRVGPAQTRWPLLLFVVPLIVGRVVRASSVRTLLHRLYPRSWVSMR